MSDLEYDRGFGSGMGATSANHVAGLPYLPQVPFTSTSGLFQPSEYDGDLLNSLGLNGNNYGPYMYNTNPLMQQPQQGVGSLGTFQNGQMDPSLMLGQRFIKLNATDLRHKSLFCTILERRDS